MFRLGIKDREIFHVGQLKSLLFVRFSYESPDGAEFLIPSLKKMGKRFGAGILKRNLRDAGGDPVHEAQVLAGGVHIGRIPQITFPPGK